MWHERMSCSPTVVGLYLGSSWDTFTLGRGSSLPSPSSAEGMLFASSRYHRAYIAASQKVMC